MISQLARLVAEYLGTFASLARSEAGHDLAQAVSALKRYAFAALAAVLGLLWLNIALLLWLLQSPWYIGGALLIGVGLMVAAWALTRTRLVAAGGPLPHTRELVRAEIHALGIEGQHPAAHALAGGEAPADASAAPAPAPAPAPSEQPDMTPALARARVRLTRNRIGQLLTPPEPPPSRQAALPPGQPPAVARAGFVPKSRTMRLLMEYWGGRPDKGVAGTVVSSLLGYVALRSRKLRRAVVLLGMARNVRRMVGKRLRSG